MTKENNQDSFLGFDLFSPFDWPFYFKGCVGIFVAIVGISVAYFILGPISFLGGDVVETQETTTTPQIPTNDKEPEPPEAETVIPLTKPEPGSGESYFNFDLEGATFNLILPENTQVNASGDAKDEEGNLTGQYYAADLGNSYFLSIQLNNIPPALNIKQDGCTAFTEERLSDFDFEGDGFFGLRHESGTWACVYDGRAFNNNNLFELNLLHQGTSYEMQTLGISENGSTYVPRGFLDIEISDGSTNTFIFADGFESGDTSVWSN